MIRIPPIEKNEEKLFAYEECSERVSFRFAPLLYKRRKCSRNVRTGGEIVESAERVLAICFGKSLKLVKVQ